MSTVRVKACLITRLTSLSANVLLSLIEALHFWKTDMVAVKTSLAMAAAEHYSQPFQIFLLLSVVKMYGQLRTPMDNKAYLAIIAS